MLLFRGSFFNFNSGWHQKTHLFILSPWFQNMNHPATHKHHDINRMHRLPAKRLSPRRQDQQLEDCCRRNAIILQWQWLCIDSFAFLLGASNQHTHSQTQSEWKKKATDENVLSRAFRTQEQIIHHMCSENTKPGLTAVLFLRSRADAGAV